LLEDVRVAFEGSSEDFFDKIVEEIVPLVGGHEFLRMNKNRGFTIKVEKIFLRPISKLTWLTSSLTQYKMVSTSFNLVVPKGLCLTP
jgi:hypothetical protein